MGYSETERELTLHFREGITGGVIPGTGVTLSVQRFRSTGSYLFSDATHVPEMFRFLFRSREAEERNREFSYYIMSPGNCDGRGPIIMLHGLNERRWDKYFQWGISLAEGTGRPVILFPLAWHMNRSPRSWVDRHLMMPLVAARTSLLPDTRLTTFVNVALSTRMTISPQRFVLSGYQTIKDLEILIRLLQEGSVPGIASGGAVDIFAYSIGALATQVMMLSESSPLPDNSRVMLFCGGSAFSLMNGTSKLIMDSRAFEKLLSFYLGLPAGTGRRTRDSLAELMNDTPEGRAFYHMTSLQRLESLSVRPFRKWEGRLRAVTLTGDTVIPPDAIRKTLRGADVQVWDPGYRFTHESPFPLLAGERTDAVDRTFGRLFETAAGFLS
ncbi:MAG: hypothetical protein GX622_11665 [Bacteroidales bacterium]|nr:hypothetical protein [Bacteroidales bacterium]